MKKLTQALKSLFIAAVILIPASVIVGACIAGVAYPILLLMENF